MKTVVLFGAGQIGAMVSRLMGPEYRVACFADNWMTNAHLRWRRRFGNSDSTGRFCVRMR